MLAVVRLSEEAQSLREVPEGNQPGWHPEGITGWLVSKELRLSTD